jgi:asparagine N-glycosylation enzyme membrane subunit Stt3
VIAHANLGHAIQYGARRATATDPFWWYIGRRNWDASFAFLEARSEARALRLAEVLEGRYVITTSQEEPRSVAGQLHAHDGRATGNKPALTRFRLVGESLPGGKGVSEIFRPRSGGGVAYKLFQIVPGARAVIEASPGEIVEVSLKLRSNQGRAFDYAAQAVADENGEAVLILPYSTDRGAFSETPRRTQAVAPYWVKRNDGTERLGVPESAVLTGAEVRMPGR